MSTKITVLIADDHTILRRGLASLLSLSENIEVVGEAGDGRTAVAMALELEPDVVLMDLSMPVLNGLEATGQLKRDAPGIKVLILSAHDNDEYVAQVVRSGANGYVLKNTSPDELNQAIRAVHSGQAFFSPSLGDRRQAFYQHPHCRHPHEQHHEEAESPRRRKSRHLRNQERHCYSPSLIICHFH